MPADDPPIRLRGCRVHNLQNVDVDIPRGKLVVICGLSGSGKTSLALDTLYAEGQRAYIESFSAYARQFLQRLDKPDCDEISGIPPALAVTRQGTTKTNRSTVATATDIADHLRLLFAKTADLFCHRCARPVRSDDPERVAAQLSRLPQSTRIIIAFPLRLPGPPAAAEQLAGLQQEGYVRLILGDTTYRLSDQDPGVLAGRIDAGGAAALVVVDRVTPADDLSRLTESLETAMGEGVGRGVVLVAGPPSIGAEDSTAGDATQTVDGVVFTHRVISQGRRCDACDIEYPEPVPRLFNFNNPLGACPRCEGFGDVVDIDMNLVVPDPSKTLRQGAIAPWTTPAYRHELDELLALAKAYRIPTDVPYERLDERSLELIRRGVPERKFGGLDGFFAWLDRKKYKLHVRIFAARYRSYRTCPQCGGRRLRDEALAYRVGGRNITQWMSLQADQLRTELSRVPWDDRQAAIAAEPIRQIDQRLSYLGSVGLGYLQLDRTLRTLSSGETQRVALTAALGSTLVNMLYVLDEPTAGLHPADVEPLCRTILGLRDRGNTVVVVEHDATLIAAADHVIEIGPGAGVAGGRVTFAGTVAELMQTPDNVTAQFLRGQRGSTLTEHVPRRPTGWIRLRGASGHNLQRVDVDFPLGTLCLVTGVSGSGKSSLVQDTLYPAVAARLGDDAGRDDVVGGGLPFDSLHGVERIQTCMAIDQSAISRSPRSCPVTFVKAFDPIRSLFAETVAARTRNLTASHFSFNNAAGQCPQCEGSGVLEIDMQFLADVSMRCPSCEGKRYRDEILEVTYRDRSIADVLSMTAVAAYHFFRGHAKVQARIKRMIDVGLEYVRLGQAATTLSSGEGQRLKLAAFLAAASRKKTLFLMDEPTTGLHFADVVRLVDCFDALIADGHSLIIVEHNPLLMKAADYLIDLGPGAADAGGRIVAVGTPAEIAAHPDSRTGRAIATQD